MLQIVTETTLYDNKGREIAKISWLSPDKYSIMFKKVTNSKRKEILEFIDKLNEKNSEIFELNEQYERFNSLIGV